MQMSNHPAAGRCEVVTLNCLLVWTFRVRQGSRLFLLGQLPLAVHPWPVPGQLCHLLTQLLLLSIITGVMVTPAGFEPTQLDREDVLRPRTTNVLPLATIGIRCTDFVETSRKRRHGLVWSKMSPCPCFNRLPTERIGHRTFKIVKATFRRAGLSAKHRFTRRHP